MLLTSGYPVGKRYSSGTIFLMRARFSFVDGLMVYSVRAMLVVGVCGLCWPLVPLTTPLTGRGTTGVSCNEGIVKGAVTGRGMMLEGKALGGRKSQSRRIGALIFVAHAGTMALGRDGFPRGGDLG